MVLEMLDLSRLEAGKVKLARDEFSLTKMAHAVFEKLERAAEERGLQIEFSAPGEFMLTADEGRIWQAVENLASNAVKYTIPGGKILVKIKTEGERTVFAIENDSPPLPEKTLEKVWDAFYRADESRTGEGTGLGLAIAKSIVELHGGKCFARNTKAGVEFGFMI